MIHKLFFGLLAVMALFIQQVPVAESAEPDTEVKLGYVSVTYGFNSVAKSSEGKFVYVEGLKRVQALSGGKVEVIQVPLFPGNLTEEGLPDTKKLFGELRRHTGTVMPILMLTEDPLDRQRKDAVVDMLTTLLMGCSKLGATECSSTTFEAWMKGAAEGAKPLTGKALDEAIDHLVEVHVLAIQRAKAEGCIVAHLDMEYLRTIEFTTFTNAEVAWRVIDGINKRLGFVFVRFLDDSAHAGNSGLSVERINVVRAKTGKVNAYGTIHVSEPTTRGLIGSGSPYALNALRDMACYGRPSFVLVEIFDSRLPDTQAMVDNIPGYGKVTFADPAKAICHGLLAIENTLDSL